MRIRTTHLPVFTVLCLLLAPPVSAAAAEGEDAPSDASQYRSCVELSARTPQQAHDTASDWLVDGGGIPAQHCVALSLAGLGRYDEAARTLELQRKNSGSPK